MNKLKKILVPALIVIFVAVCGIWMFSSDLEHIEDTNGADNYSLQTITDENIINLDIGALNYSESTDNITNTTTYSSDKFTGVAEIYGSNYFGSTLEFRVNHAQVTQGNFKMVIVVDDEIVHEFELNELTQTYTLENVTGYVALRIAGESAEFMFDYNIY